jgi:hypothetical protein
MVCTVGLDEVIEAFSFTQFHDGSAFSLGIKVITPWKNRHKTPCLTECRDKLKYA